MCLQYRHEGTIRGRRGFDFLRAAASAELMDTKLTSRASAGLIGWICVVSYVALCGLMLLLR